MQEVNNPVAVENGAQIDSEQQQDGGVNLDTSEMLDQAIDDHDGSDEGLNSSENGGEDADGVMPAYLKQHFRKQEKKIKAANRELNSRLQMAEQELTNYKQLFGATYGEANRTGNPAATQQVSGAPVDVESTVIQTLNKVQNQQRAQAEARIHQQMMTEFKQNLDEASDKYDDFDDVVYADDNPINPIIAQTAQYLPNPGDVLYALSKNKAELKRINQLSGPQQIKAIAAFAIKLASSSNNVTKAPKPLGGQTMKSSPTKKAVGSEGMSVSEMKAHLKNKYKTR